MTQVILVTAGLAAPTLFASDSDITTRDRIREIYTCKAYNEDGLMVAMWWDRDEAKAELKVLQTCRRHEHMNCERIICYVDIL
jgi:hypothetical protein